MGLVEIATEQTTAATDALLAIVSLVFANYVHHLRRQDRWKCALWTWFFALMAIAAALGAITHGLTISQVTETFLWALLNLALGLLIAIFIAAVLHDLQGEARSRKTLPIMVATGLGFWGTTLLYPDRFLLFVVYEAVALLFALAGYLWLAGRGRLQGAWLMVGGIAVSILAASVQAGGTLTLTLLWSFDHNGVYHLIQLLGMVLLLAGLRKSLSAGF